MRAMRLRLPLAATAVSLLLATGANAGQRRVDVGVGSGSIRFGPENQAINDGDHVTWVWSGNGGGHTVTNGLDGDDPASGMIFDSGNMSGTPRGFTWKADRTGTINYYCAPHVGSGMIGTLAISASGVAVSSFRISEVQYNHATGLDRIEIANLGGDSGDLGRYRIAISASASVLVPLNSVFVVSGASPGRVVIHTNEPGTNSPTDFYMGGIGDLPTSGSVALYAPNTKLGTSLTDATQIIDFVQWGAGGQANAATAVAAGVWPSTGEFVPAVPVLGDYDIAFCGAESQRGAAFWNVAHPNFRTQTLCATPTRATTWGRIKVLYR